MKIVGSCQCL